VVVSIPHGPEAWSGHSPVTFTPDSKVLLASRAGSPPTKLVGVDVASGAITDLTGYPTGPAVYHFSADHTVVLTRTLGKLGSFEVAVWAVPLGEKPLWKLGGENKLTGGIGLSADGKVAMSVAYPSGAEIIRGAPREITIWDVPSGKPPKVIMTRLRPYFEQPILSPDGKLLASYDRADANQDGQLTLWDTATGQAMPIPVEPLRALRFTADSRTLVGILKANQVGFVDVVKGKLVWAVGCDFPWVNHVAVSADGNRVAIVGGEVNDARRVQVLDVE
jgi:WD40 repeat protein